MSYFFPVKSIDLTSSRFGIKDLKISPDVEIVPIPINDRNSKIQTSVTQDSHKYVVPASSELHYGQRFNTFFYYLFTKYCFDKRKLIVGWDCGIYIKDMVRSPSQTR